MSEETTVSTAPTVTLAVEGDAESAARITGLCRDAGITVLDAGAADVEAADLVAVCTTGEAVTPLAARLPRPERCAGLHLVDGLGGKATLVEVIAAEQTTPGTLQSLYELVTSLGLEAVATKDRPGFLVGRLVMPYLNQAIAALDDGIATAEDIDLSVVLGLGYPVGPLRLLDGLGLDAHLEATTAAAAGLGDPHYVPPPLLTRRVEAGYLGRPTGRGFQTYQETTTP